MNQTNTQILANFKVLAQGNQLIPRKFYLHEIKIIDSTMIDVKGVCLELEPKAFRDIIGILGMTEKVLKVFDTNFGIEKTNAVISLIQENLSRSGLSVTFYANPNTKTVARIVPENKTVKGLSLNTYFNTIDRILEDHPDFVIKRSIADPMQVQLDLLDPKAEFRVGGQNMETFHPGITLGTSFNQPTFIQNFTERLVCTNGMIHRDNSTSYSLNENFTKKEWVKFFEHVEGIKKNGWVSPKFNQKIERAMVTPASLAEMKHFASLIGNYTGKDKDLWIPLTETENRFKGIGVDTDKLNEHQLSTAKTGMKVWDLINQVTDFASHNYNYKIDDMSRMRLQIEAGKCLMKENYDMENIITKSPF